MSGLESLSIMEAYIQAFDLNMALYLTCLKMENDNWIIECCNKSTFLGHEGATPRIALALRERLPPLSIFRRDLFVNHGRKPNAITIYLQPSINELRIHTSFFKADRRICVQLLSHLTLQEDEPLPIDHSYSV